MSSVQLNSGHEMPLLGLGTWKSQPGEVGAAVKHSLLHGYKHIDCAHVYGNEGEIGAALQEVFAAGVKREDVFVTSKLWNTCHSPEHVRGACEETLKKLGLQYLDLYLIHWPVCFQHAADNFPKDANGNMLYANVAILDTWRAMEELVDLGLVRSIGLSNFNSKQITELHAQGRIKPAVLQVESHPYFSQEPLINFCHKLGVQVTAYSPLGSPGNAMVKDLLLDPTIIKIAAAHGRSPAQVCIRYQVQRNVIVIPKSVTPSRIEENGNVFDFSLTQEEMAEMAALNKNLRACVPTVKNEQGVDVPRDDKHMNYPFLEPF